MTAQISAQLLFPPATLPTLRVQGMDRRYPVKRIFCVGRNYADHAKEMGFEVDREAPFYFQKSALTLVHSGATTPYPPGTADFHHEMELVVALGAEVFQADLAAAEAAVFGYAAGLDMTRRDLQLASRKKERPWTFGKDFENAAVIGDLTPSAQFGPIADQRIRLSVDGEIRQDARLSDLVWSVPEVIAHLSGFYHLAPGDLIYTGTPAGVGPVLPGNVIHGEIDGLAPVELTIGPAA